MSSVLTSEVFTSVSDRIKSVRELYLAFAVGDHDFVDGILAGEFTFASPVDVGLDARSIFRAVLAQRRPRTAVRVRAAA